jgi:hypothetical protein
MLSSFLNYSSSSKEVKSGAALIIAPDGTLQTVKFVNGQWPGCHIFFPVFWNPVADTNYYNL